MGDAPRSRFLPSPGKSPFSPFELSHGETPGDNTAMVASRKPMMRGKHDLLTARLALTV